MRSPEGPTRLRTRSGIWAEVALTRSAKSSKGSRRVGRHRYGQGFAKTSELQSLAQLSGNAEAMGPENVTDSSLDSMQIDENRCQKLHRNLLL